LAIESTTDFVRMTRGVLAGAGFVRKEVGETVYWVTPHPPSAPSPLTRGEGDRASLTFSPPRGEKVPKADEGSTLVLVHGANDQAGTWFTVAPALAREHRVILPDLPGHGESAPRTGPLPLSLIVSRLEAVIDDAAPNARITLVGNSLGGWLVMLYALKHPERVERLVLEASGGLTRPLAVPIVAHTREEAIPILRAVHGPQYEPQEWVIEALLQRAHGSPMLRLTEHLEHNIEPRLAELTMPATLIWGEHDGVLPLSYAEALRDAIPNAELRVIRDAAHIPHFQQPERFLQCLTAIC
jgi:pimeloyl-ACP methyl ester carboxylesterase